MIKFDRRYFVEALKDFNLAFQSISDPSHLNQSELDDLHLARAQTYFEILISQQQQQQQQQQQSQQQRQTSISEALIDLNAIQANRRTTDISILLLKAKVIALYENVSEAIQLINDSISEFKGTIPLDCWQEIEAILNQLRVQKQRPKQSSPVHSPNAVPPPMLIAIKPEPESEQSQEKGIC